MVGVHITTDQWGDLDRFLTVRSETGQNRYDEWWDGEYRVVTGPTPEHGELVVALSELLGPVVRAARLKMAAPVNIGVDKWNCRVPDLGVYARDTPRSSPAFLLEALLVIEVLSPGERSRAKVEFYAEHGVKDYLEINLNDGMASLLRLPEADEAVEAFTLDLMVTDRKIWTPTAGLRITDFTAET